MMHITVWTKIILLGLILLPNETKAQGCGLKQLGISQLIELDSIKSAEYVYFNEGESANHSKKSYLFKNKQHIKDVKKYNFSFLYIDRYIKSCNERDTLSNMLWIYGKEKVNLAAVFSDFYFEKLQYIAYDGYLDNQTEILEDYENTLLGIRFNLKNPSSLYSFNFSRFSELKYIQITLKSETEVDAELLQKVIPNDFKRCFPEKYYGNMLIFYRN